MQTSSRIRDFFRSSVLPQIHADCWALLTQAVLDRECGWRLPVLATAAAEGVCQRTVVLRAVDDTACVTSFHTDRRSAKVRQIQSNPRVSLLFYDHLRSVQMQLLGTARIHLDDPLADRAWSASMPESLRGYLGPLTPGTVTDEPWTNLPDHLRSRLPERYELEPGRPHFAVIEVTVERLDWLLLSREGNQRARFQYSVDSPTDVGRLPFKSEWLSP